MLHRKNQVQIFTSQGHKGSTAFTGGDTETLIEFATVFFAQKAIGLCERGYSTDTQFLW